MRPRTALRSLALVLLCLTAGVAVFVAWAHPQSPVGRCAAHDWPPEPGWPPQEKMGYTYYLRNLIAEPSRLPEGLDGLYPVRGESWVSQVEGVNPRTDTHFPRFGNQFAVDIAAEVGAPVVAFRSGRVVHLQDGYPDFPCGGRYSMRASEGNTVTVEDASGLWITYHHLQKGSLAVKLGEQIEAGRLIAAVGRSGTGWKAPHLHLEAGGEVVVDGKVTRLTVPLRFRICGSNDAARRLDRGERFNCDG
jgi:murein DD-endopeptidase MepM/ murein hydrolase activator NlpD